MVKCAIAPLPEIFALRPMRLVGMPFGTASWKPLAGDAAVTIVTLCPRAASSVAV